MSLPVSIKLVEVGPRDGLQNISVPIATDDKVRYIDLLTESGFPEIEVTSFVSPKWIPQLADSKEVSAEINRLTGITYTAMVPNLRGLENALSANYNSVAVFTAASETFSKKNTNCSIDESIARFHEMISLWEEHSLRVRGYISTVWHCPYEGPIKTENVVDIIAKLLDLGINEISLGDTIGKATADEVRYSLQKILKRWHPDTFALHMHDTFGFGIENIKAAMEFEIPTFDSSTGGIGGCPYAEGASGNIASEKVVALCKSLGIETGINEESLDKTATFIQSIVEKESLAHAED
tara:strand:- start:1462 stop:2346 length:885 start_codon:yes stop_codon:yes gene_type:complete